MKLIGDLMYTWSIRASTSSGARSDAWRPRRPCRLFGARLLGSTDHAPDPATPGTSRATGAATGRCGSSSFLFVLSLFAEFIANDKPLLVYFEGQLYTPVWSSLPGDRVRRLLPDRGRLPRSLRAGADRGKGLDALAADPLQLRHRHRDPSPAPSPPDSEHWLGTDDQARDVVARVIYGFRISVLFGLTLTIISPSSASPPARCRATSAAGSTSVPALHRDLVGLPCSTC
jgi:hypothetical protein